MLRRRLRPKPPSAAMIVAIVALFVALGGTGYAVSKLPRNSVGAKQLKRGAVTNRKIAQGAVTGDKIRNGSITPDKLAPAGGASSQGGKTAGIADSAQLQTFNVAMNRGDGARAVFSHAPFSLTGRCQSNGNAIQATLEATTTAANSAFESDLFTDSDWNPGETRIVQSVTAPAGAREDDSSQLKMFNTGVGVYSYIGDGEPVGVLVGFQGAECRFIGHLVFYS